MSEELNLTADVSDEQLEEEGHDDSFATPLSSAPAISDADRRLSSSQPILSSKTTVGQAFSSMSNVKHSERFPFLQVKEDNERLQAEVFELRGQLRDSQTRQAFAEEQLPLPVREVLDDYLRLQRLLRDSDEKAADYDKLKNELISEKHENQELTRHIEETIHHFESLLHRKNEEMERLKMDFIAGDEFTLNSEAGLESGNKTIALELNQQKIMNDDYLRKIARLENDLVVYKERLSEAERHLVEKQDVTRTFVLSENEQQLAKRVDELVVENSNLANRYNSCNMALMNYMNRLNKLEKKVMMSAMSSSQLNLSSSFDISDKQRVETVLEKMKSELIAEKEKNRTLRNEVNNLMGKDISSESIEDATEALEDESVVDQGMEKIVDEVNTVLLGLKETGWAESSVRCNELLDSIDCGDHLENREQDMVELFGQSGQPQLLPDLDQLSLLNTSIGNILTTSMNAAHDITIVKENLASFRDSLVNMFERLKSSAALFDEIRQILSNGEHNPLVDRIRDMQLLWNSAAIKADDVTRAIDAAERSIVGMQGHISALEQTIVNTSFVLDQTRRLTFSNLSLVSRFGQETTTVAAEDRMGELEEQVKELTEQLEILIEARDSAQKRVEILEKQSGDYDMENIELHQQLDDMKTNLNRLRTERDKAQDELTILSSDHIHVKSMLDRNSTTSTNYIDQIENLTAENLELKAAVEALTTTRNDLCQKIVDVTDETAQAKDFAHAQELAKEALSDRVLDLKNTCHDLQRDLESAQLSIRHKSSEMERIQKGLESKIDLLEEQLDAARRNNSDLQKELQSAELVSKEKSQPADKPWPNVASPNISLLYKNPQPPISSQTSLHCEDIRTLEEEHEKLSSDFTSLLTIYNELEVALRELLFLSESSGSKTAGDICSARKNCEKLKKAITEQANYDAKTKEQVQRMTEDLEQKYTLTTDSKQSKFRENYSVSRGPRKNATSKFTYSKISDQYQNRLLRDINTAFVKTVDLAYNLKVSVDAKKKDYEFDLGKLNNDAKEVRTILYDVKNYLCTKFDKENLHGQSAEFLSMLQSMEHDNKELFNKLTQTMGKYQELKKTSGNPNVLFRIDQELHSIHDVMQRTREVVASRSRKTN